MYVLFGTLHWSCFLHLFLGKYLVIEWIKSLVSMPAYCIFWKNSPCCGSGLSMQCLFPNADWFHRCVPSLLFSLVGRWSLAVLGISRNWGLPYKRPVQPCCVAARLQEVGALVTWRLWAWMWVTGLPIRHRKLMESGDLHIRMLVGPAPLLP